MLKLHVLGLAVALFFLASPCQALITPGDVFFEPAATPNTLEDVLNQQIDATYGPVSGAHAGDDPVPQSSDFFADAHTKVENRRTGETGYFELLQFDPTRTLYDNGSTPISNLQGVLLYFTVHLKSGRQVLDNESKNDVENVILTMVTNLQVWSADPTIGVNSLMTPSVSASGKLLGDTDGRDYALGSLPVFAGMTQEQLDAYSYGPDRLAAVITDDPNNSYSLPPIVYLDTNPGDSAMLGAFTSTGPDDTLARFDYTSWLKTSHAADSLGVVSWSVAPTFDIEARVVYLYAAVPEPISMGLLAVAFGPVLLRRLRRRKTRLS